MDLTTQYLGLTLKHPLVPSPSPLSHDLDRMRSLEDGGAPAIVMFSIFEEEVQHTSVQLTHYLEYGSQSVAEVTNYMPEPFDFIPPIERYLDLLSRAKSALDIPIIASLNCTSVGEWLTYASLIQEAGADAIELNLYDLPTDPFTDGPTIESHYAQIVASLKENVALPIAVKLHPFFTSLPHVAKKLSDAGADGLVLFNRFYQPDIDIDEFQVVPGLRLSDSHELRLPLRWTAILSGRIDADIAITTGIHTASDLIKSLMVGANVGMIASELLRNGPSRINEIIKGLQAWMEEHEYESVEQLQGCMSYQHVEDPSHYVRANYIRTLHSFRFDPTGQDY